MIKEFLYTVNYLLGRDIAGRMLIVFPDDVFLVSYPKSGNTWIRFLIGNLVHPEEPITFANVRRMVPDLHIVSKRELRKTPRPRIIKSHECFDPRYPRVIYVVRDPRDVAVSAYHFARKRRRIDDSLPIETYVSTRLLSSGEPYQPYGTWGENAGSWLANARNLAQISRVKEDVPGTIGTWEANLMSWLGARGNSRSLLVLKYENLIEDTPRELAKVSAFLGLNSSPEAIAKAVELSSADNMRKLEGKQTDQWATTRGSRTDIKFVRAARSGQWKESLPAASVAEIESAWGCVMQLLGYELSARPEAGSATSAEPVPAASRPAPHPS